MMIDRRLIQEIDWVLLGLVLLLALVGVIFIYSSSHFLPGGFHTRQLVWIGVSLVALLLVLTVDYKFFVSVSPYLYGLIVAILLATLVFARLFAEYKGAALTRNYTIGALLVAGVPLGLIVLQPDLGTAMTFTAIIGGAFILLGSFILIYYSNRMHHEELKQVVMPEKGSVR